MLTGHRQKHSGDFRIVTDVFVDCLAYIVPQRNFVFCLAGNFARVTAETATSVNKPAKFFAIIGCLDQVFPNSFRLEQVFTNFVVW